MNWLQNNIIVQAAGVVFAHDLFWEGVQCSAIHVDSDSGVLRHSSSNSRERGYAQSLGSKIKSKTEKNPSFLDIYLNLMVHVY